MFRPASWRVSSSRGRGRSCGKFCCDVRAHLAFLRVSGFGWIRSKTRNGWLTTNSNSVPPPTLVTNTPVIPSTGNGKNHKDSNTVEDPASPTFPQGILNAAATNAVNEAALASVAAATAPPPTINDEPATRPIDSAYSDATEKRIDFRAEEGRFEPAVITTSTTTAPAPELASATTGTEAPARKLSFDEGQVEEVVVRKVESDEKVKGEEEEEERNEKQRIERENEKEIREPRNEKTLVDSIAPPAEGKSLASEKVEEAAPGLIPPSVTSAAGPSEAPPMAMEPEPKTAGSMAAVAPPAAASSAAAHTSDDNATEAESSTPEVSSTDKPTPSNEAHHHDTNKYLIDASLLRPLSSTATVTTTCTSNPAARPTTPQARLQPKLSEQQQQSSPRPTTAGSTGTRPRTPTPLTLFPRPTGPLSPAVVQATWLTSPSTSQLQLQLPRTQSSRPQTPTAMGTSPALITASPQQQQQQQQQQSTVGPSPLTKTQTAPALAPLSPSFSPPQKANTGAGSWKKHLPRASTSGNGNGIRGLFSSAVQSHRRGVSQGGMVG